MKWVEMVVDGVRWDGSMGWDVVEKGCMGWGVVLCWVRWDGDRRDEASQVFRLAGEAGVCCCCGGVVRGRRRGVG